MFGRVCDNGNECRQLRGVRGGVLGREDVFCGSVSLPGGQDGLFRNMRDADNG